MGGASGTSAFTLPAGARPTYALSMIDWTSNGPSTIAMGTGGGVTPFYPAGGTTVGFDALTFTVD